LTGDRRIWFDASDKLFEEDEGNNSRSLKIGGLKFHKTLKPAQLKQE